MRASTDASAVATSKMPISASNLMRLAGLSALIAGTCYVLVGIFHPANIPSSVTTTRWETVHVLACAMSFFGVLGMAGLYARQAVKTGWLGLAGYIMLEPLAGAHHGLQLR